ncbi:MAG: glycosyltransferase family 4 protein [Chloroflexi bacterium]|nr:glycosyltransferase family 4 protein [Chloroflexota bacterium]
MRIGLLIYGRLETLSGGYLYDRQLVELLQRHGDEVEIISLKPSSYGRHLIHNLDGALFSHLRDTPYDLLLQDELNHPSLFWLNWQLRPFIHYPIVSIVHHLRSDERHSPWLLPAYRAIEQRYLASVDAVIANSRTTLHRVEALLPGQPPAMAQRPAMVAYPGGDRLLPDVSQHTIVSRAQKPGPLRILFVGNLIRRKGLHTLLAALTYLPPRSWLLDIVGDPTVDPTYVQRHVRPAIRQLNQGQITQHGAVSNWTLAALYNQSHVLVLPSEYEGFGIVYIEAMGFGLPVIGSTAGAADEIVQHGKNGFLLPPNNVLALAKQLFLLNEDRRLLLRLGLAAQKRYQTHPTWDESMTSIRLFLQEVAAHNHAFQQTNK